MFARYHPVFVEMLMERPSSSPERSSAGSSTHGGRQRKWERGMELAMASGWDGSRDGREGKAVVSTEQHVDKRDFVTKERVRD